MSQSRARISDTIRLGIESSSIPSVRTPVWGIALSEPRKLPSAATGDPIRLPNSKNPRRWNSDKREAQEDRTTVWRHMSSGQYNESWPHYTHFTLVVGWVGGFGNGYVIHGSSWEHMHSVILRLTDPGKEHTRMFVKHLDQQDLF